MRINNEKEKNRAESMRTKLEKNDRKRELDRAWMRARKREL